MSRSLHTQKLECRAERRLARPYSKRCTEAAYLDGSAPKPKTPDMPWRLRIRNSKPLPGMQPLLTVRDIMALLDPLGPTALYGLKAIRLRRENAIRLEGVVFAEYLPGGEIHLYAVPTLPWRLPFLLAPADQELFLRYGASIAEHPQRLMTTIHWNAATLKRFALYGVLAHELGHHLLQHHGGKRKVMFCRRSDHEQRADLESHRILNVLCPYLRLL